MLNKLGLKNLTDRRNELKLVMLHKIVNNLVDIDTPDIRFPRPSTHDTRGHSLTFLHPPTLTTALFSISNPTVEHYPRTHNQCIKHRTF